MIPAPKIPDHILNAAVEQAYSLTRELPRCWSTATTQRCISSGFREILSGNIDADSVSGVLIGWADREARITGEVVSREALAEWSWQVERTLEVVRLVLEGTR